jgi:excisionase family DNA binding protein
MILKTDSSDEILAYRVNDFCRAIGLGRSTVYELIRKGEIRTVKVGGRVLIPKASAAALLQIQA